MRFRIHGVYLLGLCGVIGAFAAGVLMHPSSGGAAVPKAWEWMQPDQAAPMPRVYLEVVRSDASIAKIGPLRPEDYAGVRMMAQSVDNQRFTLRIWGLKLARPALAVTLICDEQRWISPRFTQPAGGLPQDAEFDFVKAHTAWRVARALAIEPTVYPRPLNRAYRRAEAARRGGVDGRDRSLWAEPGPGWVAAAE